MHSVTIILVALSIYYPAVANPVQQLYPRDDSDEDNPLLSPKAWIPIVVIIVFLTFVVLFAWFKQSFRKAFAIFRVYDAHTGSNPAASAGRELTAEQLAGSDTAINLPTTRAPRRTRRPRRTPSQVSVTSLPAYNKEPGDEELVIFRSRDMEDNTIPSAIVAEEDESSLNSHDRSQVSRYTPVPTTTNEMPFLDNGHPSGDLSLSTLPSFDARRPSFDSSLHETSSLMRVDSNPEQSSDPRGEAPAYFEVVDLTQEPNPGVPTTRVSSVPSSTPPSHEPQQRRSGFRTFLNRMSMVSHVPEHRRTESDQSSTSNGHRPNRSTPLRTSNHRPSQSSSGQSMFRTISRQRSIQTLNSSVRLNSPSLISLNSISSPLSHTLIRTEFTYPKSGPTPEQLKVISSRENFSRFGMPYGPDAIAFAASSSRQDLEPPPDFEASPSQLPSVGQRLDSSGSVVGESPSRPSTPEPVLEGQGVDHGDGPLSVDRQSENVPEMSTPPIIHTETSASPSIPKISDSSVTNPTSTHTPPLLRPINEFGKFSSSSLTPQDAASRSESRTSNYSFQSYATAPESSLGYTNDGVDSGPRRD